MLNVQTVWHKLAFAKTKQVIQTILPSKIYEQRLQQNRLSCYNSLKSWAALATVFTPFPVLAKSKQLKCNSTQLFQHRKQWLICYTLNRIDNTLSGKETAEEAWFKYFSGWYFIKLMGKNVSIYFLVKQCLSISQTSLLFFYKENKLGRDVEG